MVDTAATSYDTIPYSSFPFAQSSPNRLATIATLLGLRPPPVDHCRVLELGCTPGGNLIPLAVTLPDSTFTGIDLSQVQITDGQATIDALALKNITLKHMSILDVDGSFGIFDYILCHGVYSWVPANVQDKILAIGKEHLSRNGVAYVSYNTYPGWHLRGLIRAMMRYHAQQFSQPNVQVRQARNLLDFLAEGAGNDKEPFGLLLKRELQSIQHSSDNYLYHEHLEETNDPIFFHEFATRAEAHGLRYLGEADLKTMVAANFSPQVRSVLKMLAQDAIHLEQYMDFLRNRTFRQTLLCHQQQVPNHQLGPERLANLYVASPAKPVSARPNLTASEPEEFRSPDGVTLKATEPLVKAAMVRLAEAWPRSVSFGELRSTARSRVLGDKKPDLAQVEPDTRQLGEALLSFYGSASGSLVELHVQPPKLATQVSERPVASPLARLQAQRGSQVTNLRHELVTLDEFPRQVLRRLDGTRDRAALLDALAELAERGDLAVQQDGQAVTEPGKVRKHLEKGLEEQLPQLARNALLIG